MKSSLGSKILALVVSLLCFMGYAQKQKVDGVAAVVGDYIVLDSDIDLTLIELRASGINTDQVNRCEILGKLLEDRLYAHHAIQDSIQVSDDEIRTYMDEQISVMVEQIGSLDKVVKYYNKKNEEDFRNHFFEIVKMNKLTSEMRKKIVDEIAITPEEVRQFFNNIPKDDIPTIGTEVELAQIIVKPKVSEADKQAVIDQLKSIKKDVLEFGSSFTTKAVLYSEDKASVPNGGYYKINKKTNFVKEFKDVAFSLQPGEISEPFETVYGYHIIMVDRILGSDVELRHILMSPKVSDQALRDAKETIEKIKQRIENKELTFDQAARSLSDDKDTRNSGGILLNPRTMEPTFELTKMDPAIYNKIQSMQEGEITKPFIDEEQGKGKFYKILKVNKKIAEHTADFSNDFMKIKEIALNDKKVREVAKWSNEKIEETYIKINGEYRECNFVNNWLKK